MRNILNVSKLLALLLAMTLAFSCLAACGKDDEPVDVSSSEPSSSAPSSEEESSAESSSEESSSEESSSAPSSSNNSSVEKQPTSGLLPPSGSGITPAPIVNIKAPDGVLYNKNGTQHNYVTPMDMEDNIFMDSLAYTGYDIAKHRKDGLMWQYILSSKKKRASSSGPYNWLSNISYHGTPRGYETKNGKPDIAYFEKYGLVCASYVGYVYQNYLPNVVGLDTAKLGKPSDYGWSDVLADGWYEVAKTWVQKGWSEFIRFDCRKVAGSGGQLRITPEKCIPIGSMIVTANDSNANSDYAGHVSIYAGYKYGYHWVYQVGTNNGPEFCSIERMGYNPDPHYRQWLIAIITPPNILNYAPILEVTVKDTAGNPVKDAAVSIKREKTGKVIDLGKTDANGLASKDYLYYDGVTVTCTAGGKSGTAKLTLTSKNNSVNKVTVTIK